MLRPTSFTGEYLCPAGGGVDGTAAVPGNQFIGSLADLVVSRLWRGHAVQGDTVSGMCDRFGHSSRQRGPCHLMTGNHVGQRLWLQHLHLVAPRQQVPSHL